jgi:hypothetical protein
VRGPSQIWDYWTGSGVSPTSGAYFRTSGTCCASDSACKPAMGGAAAAVRAGSEDFSGEIGGGPGCWLPPSPSGNVVTSQNFE